MRKECRALVVTASSETHGEAAVTEGEATRCPRVLSACPPVDP